MALKGGRVKRKTKETRVRFQIQILYQICRSYAGHMQAGRRPGHIFYMQISAAGRIEYTGWDEVTWREHNGGKKIQKNNLTQWSPSSSECYTEKQKQRKAEQRAGVKLIMKMETVTPQICFAQKAHSIRDVNWNTHADFCIFVSLHLSCPPAKKRCCFFSFLHLAAFCSTFSN